MLSKSYVVLPGTLYKKTLNVTTNFGPKPRNKLRNFAAILRWNGKLRPKKKYIFQAQAIFIFLFMEMTGLKTWAATPRRISCILMSSHVMEKRVIKIGPGEKNNWLSSNRIVQNGHWNRVKANKSERKFALYKRLSPFCQSCDSQLTLTKIPVTAKVTVSRTRKDLIKTVLSLLLSLCLLCKSMLQITLEN